MIRNRSNLILLLYFYQLPDFYNNYSTLFILIRRKYIWKRIYQIIWFIIWYYLIYWFMLLYYNRRLLILILFNLYSTINYNYIYFYKTNQFLFINTPIFMLFLCWNNFNILLFKYNSLFLINILFSYLINKKLFLSLFDGFIILKFLRQIPFQLIINYLQHFNYYFKLNNFNFSIIYILPFKLNFLITPIDSNCQISKFNIIHQLMVWLFFQLIIYIYNYLINLILYYFN